MFTRCIWCGDATYSETRLMCDACRLLSKNYREQVKDVSRSSSLGDKLRFRNNCMDILNFKQRGGTRMPSDIEYQLERARQYLGEA